MLGFISRILGKIIEPTESLAENIADAAMVCGHTFVNNMAKDDNGNSISTSTNEAFAINEYLYFFLHYVNRLAFQFGGVVAQNKICNDISLYAFAKLVATLPEKSRSDCFTLLQNGMNEAERVYSKCNRLTPEGDASPQGTLFWEASKRISASVEGGMEIANLMCAIKLLTPALSSLKLEDKIKSLT